MRTHEPELGVEKRQCFLALLPKPLKVPRLLVSQLLEFHGRMYISVDRAYMLVGGYSSQEATGIVKVVTGLCLESVISSLTLSPLPHINMHQDEMSCEPEDDT